jgi:hypothetical protein
MIYLVSYDLKIPGRNYEQLYNVLKSSPKWWHYLDSTWILRTSESMDIWVDRIRAVIDANDHFLIVNITRQPRNGWLPQSAWDWIRTEETI